MLCLYQLKNRMPQSSAVLGTYRSLIRLVRRLPEPNKQSAWKELRESYRKHADETSTETVTHLIEEAGKKIAFLRIITPKSRAVAQTGETRWVYKPGGDKVHGDASARKTQVVSNFDGKNLDPCSVKRHNSHLKRMGFVNNLHAKGLF